ncbi:hypothetical protein DFS34DRAFT_617960 [Phlyctochytrium arcticum]|nr:hypothetical protein DFS34DRAFT_617960 [Phlyctochytrium arcticum]
MYEVYTGDDHLFAFHRLPKDANGAPMSMGNWGKALNIAVLVLTAINVCCSGYIVYQWWHIRSKASFNFWYFKAITALTVEGRFQVTSRIFFRVLVYTILGEITFQGACLIACILRLAKVHITENSFACQGLAFIVLYSVTVKAQWISCVALNSYFAVVKQVRLTSRQELWFHLWCWGSPLLYMTIPFWGIRGGAPQYGFRNEAWCGIRPGTPAGLAIICLGFFAAPMTIMTFSYGSIMWKVYGINKSLKASGRNDPGLTTQFSSEPLQKPANNITSEQLRVMWTMVAYLVAFLIAWAPSLVDFMLELYGREYITPGWVEFFALSVCHTTGIINCVVYSRTHNSAAYKDADSHGGASSSTKNAERSVTERRSRSRLGSHTSIHHPNVHNGQFLTDEELDI